MCESCLEINKRIEQYRQLLPLNLHPKEREYIDRVVGTLDRERVRLHENLQMRYLHHLQPFRPSTIVISEVPQPHRNALSGPK